MREMPPEKSGFFKIAAFHFINDKSSNMFVGEVPLLDLFKNSVATKTCRDIAATRTTLMAKRNYEILHGSFTSSYNFFTDISRGSRIFNPKGYYVNKQFNIYSRTATTNP